MEKPSQLQIRERAYQLWEAAGKPEDREHEFWYEAERELKGDFKNSSNERSSTFLE